MSMTEAYYKDFGQNDSAQIARRQKRSIANQQAALLGQVLADQSVGVFIEATLPRCIGMGKVNLGSQYRADRLVTGKLFAVIHGDAADLSEKGP